MRPFLLLACALLLAACATMNVTKVPTVAKTDREAGTMRLTYWDGRWEYVTADWALGERDVLDQCRDWGYSKYEAAGDPVTSCTSSHQDSYGGTVCDETDIYREYRCLN